MFGLVGLLNVQDKYLIDVQETNRQPTSLRRFYILCMTKVYSCLHRFTKLNRYFYYDYISEANSFTSNVVLVCSFHLMILITMTIKIETQDCSNDETSSVLTLISKSIDKSFLWICTSLRSQ